jgi:hypothetical protein
VEPAAHLAVQSQTRATLPYDGSPLVVSVPVVAFGRPILVGPPCEHARRDDAAGDEHESYQPKYR